MSGAVRRKLYRFFCVILWRFSSEKMKPKLRIVLSHQHNPYLNLAVENGLLQRHEPNAVTLFLWRNERTVVIGANQNPFAECNLQAMADDGVLLARRRTGGGAVFHDLGNLNFSFVADKSLYDVPRQMRVIQQALRHFGLETEVSGRNDITFDGRKFSGNAFGSTREQALHHGTLLIKTDAEKMMRYLNVNRTKLQKHGVQSVASRVVNLSDVAPITAENVMQPLIEAFQNVYENVAEVVDFDALCDAEAIAFSQKIQSEEYLLGRWREFRAVQSGHFAWGSVAVDLRIDEQRGVISSATIASDSLQPEAIAQAENLLKNASTTAVQIIPEGENQQILKDIFSLIF